MTTITPAAPVSALTALGSSAAVAGEVLARISAELPGVLLRDDRERLLLSTWLLTIRSPATRRAYLGDAGRWLDWLAERHIDVLDARRLHVDLWVSTQLAEGAANASVCRRLAAISRFYAHLARHDLIEHQPVAGVVRPAVDPDATTTLGLDRAQAQALLVAAETDTGRCRLRTIAAIKLLLHNGLRVGEVLDANVADLGADRGHRILDVTGKGDKQARIPLAPSTWSALETYLQMRADKLGLDSWRELRGPLLVTSTGHRVHRSQMWELIQRLARSAGIEEWSALAIHSLRHTAITLILDDGTPLRDAQDYARHKDPRTTRRYDRNRGNLDRHPAYTLAALLAT